MAVVLDTGGQPAAATRAATPSVTSAQFVDHDAIDAVILLPDNMFFNTSAPGIILVARKADAAHRDPTPARSAHQRRQAFCESRPKTR